MKALKASVAAEAKSIHTRPARSRRRGFSLIELLIMILILGLIAVVGVGEATRAINKTRLAATAQDILIFSQSALSEMHKPRGVSSAQMEIFLRINARNADLSTQLDLLTDDDGDGLLTNADSVIRSYTIPKDMILAPSVSPTPVDCLYGGTGCATTSAKVNVASLNWSSDADDAAISRALRLDFRGRTINVVSGTASTTMVTNIVRLAITHRRMSEPGSGRITPLTSYEITISPLWNVSMKRGIWNGAKFVYN